MNCLSFSCPAFPAPHKLAVLGMESLELSRIIWERFCVYLKIIFGYILILNYENVLRLLLTIIMFEVTPTSYRHIIIVLTCVTTVLVEKESYRRGTTYLPTEPIFQALKFRPTSVLLTDAIFQIPDESCYRFPIPSCISFACQIACLIHSDVIFICII
jgi:hypothetical protein